jgi:hypothetical protein
LTSVGPTTSISITYSGYLPFGTEHKLKTTCGTVDSPEIVLTVGQAACTLAAATTPVNVTVKSSITTIHLADLFTGHSGCAMPTCTLERRDSNNNWVTYVADGSTI